MKAYTYLYSRSYYINVSNDYSFLTLIDELPADVKRSFNSKVRLLMSDKVSYEFYLTPTWLLVKEQNCLLWGMAVANCQLTEKDFCNDQLGRNLVCFCGVVFCNIDDSVRLPFSVNAFTSAFESFMSEHFRDYVQTTMRNVAFPFDGSLESIVCMPDSRMLNTDKSVCRIFPYSTDRKRLVAESLSTSADISLVIDAAPELQLYNDSCVFVQNAIIRNYEKAENIVVKKKEEHKEKPKERPRVSDSNDYDKDDKEIQHKEEECKCRICGKQTEHVNEDGVCLDCEEKLKRKKTIRYFCIGFFVIVSVLCVIKYLHNETVENHSGREDRKTSEVRHLGNVSDSIKNDMFWVHPNTIGKKTGARLWIYNNGIGKDSAIIQHDY